MPCKPLGIDRRRGDDELQIRTARQQLAQVAEQKVDVERTLVRLVDDQRVVARKARIRLRLGEQDAVGHQLHRHARSRLVGEPHLVADHLAERRLQFLRDAARDARCRDPARLRMTDDAARTTPQLQADLRQLRRLARAGFSADDHHLVRGDRACDVLAPGRDRQLLGEADFRQRRANPWPRVARRSGRGGLHRLASHRRC